MSHGNHTTQRQLQVGAQVIAYSLTLANRKSVGITIHPDMRVAVRAPQGSSHEAIDEIVRKRAAWIMRNLHKFAQRPPKQPPSTKPQGDTYLFLGRYLPLKVTSLSAAAATREGVKLDNDTLYVWVKETKDKRRVTARLEKWSREQAFSIFSRRMAALFPRFNGLLTQMPELAIRRMKARWGSCSSNGKITINLNLIHLDESLIDYVVVHELCHLIEHNHSKRYYALLTRMMPDWRARRQCLNELGMPE